MNIVVVDATPELRQLLAVAVELARPATPVTLCPDIACARRALELLERAGTPAAVILGPRAAAETSAAELATLRAGSDPAAIVALALEPPAAPPHALDAVYPHPLDWPAFAGTVARILDEWMK